MCTAAARVRFLCSKLVIQVCCDDSDVNGGACMKYHAHRARVEPVRPPGLAVFAEHRVSMHRTCTCPGDVCVRRKCAAAGIPGGLLHCEAWLYGGHLGGSCALHMVDAAEAANTIQVGRQGDHRLFLGSWEQCR